MLYFHKLLPFFLLPLGLTFILVLAGLLTRRRLFTVIGLAVLLISAMPISSDLLMRTVEGWEIRVPAGKMPEADAIVVLSGGRTLAPGDPPMSEWMDPDRFFGGVELFRAGKAQRLIFTGGWVPWHPKAEPEGEVLMKYAVDFGVPLERILVTHEASNTAQEAASVADLLRGRKRGGDPPTVLLVTSAYHMRRAKFLFECSGLPVIPFRVDFRVSAGKKRTFLDFIPTGEGLRQTEIALREVYGLCYYRLRHFLRF